MALGTKVLHLQIQVSIIITPPQWEDTKNKASEMTHLYVSHKNIIIIRNWEGLSMLLTQRGWDQKRGNLNMSNKIVNQKDTAWECDSRISGSLLEAEGESTNVSSDRLSVWLWWVLRCPWPWWDSWGIYNCLRLPRRRLFFFWYTSNLSTLVGDLISSSSWPKGDGKADQHHWRALNIYQETTAVSTSSETSCVAAVLAVKITDTNSWVTGQELLHFNIRFVELEKFTFLFVCVWPWWQSSWREHWVTGYWIAVFLSCSYDIIAAECQSLGVHTFSKL